MRVGYMRDVSKQVLLRYIYTIKYLKFIQIFYRLYYLVKKSRIITVKNTLLRHWDRGWLSLIFSPARLAEDLTFTCFGKSGSLTDLTVWNSTQHAKLWLYNLHYFDDLNSKFAEQSFDLYVIYINK